LAAHFEKRFVPASHAGVETAGQDHGATVGFCGLVCQGLASDADHLRLMNKKAYATFSESPPPAIFPSCMLLV
jgi:hypothetical protein